MLRLVKLRKDNFALNSTCNSVQLTYFTVGEAKTSVK